VRLEDGIVVECSKSESSVSVLDGGHDWILSPCKSVGMNGSES
jgi:hypothetical protein